MTTLHPTTQPWFIYDSSNANDVMFFLFNPTDMTVSYNAEWDTKHVAFVHTKTSTFKSRAPKSYKFDMYLNEWGEHLRPTNLSSVRMTVEQRIEWINQKMYPIKTQDRKMFKPPILIFFWRSLEPVVITDMRVKRTKFRPLTDEKLSLDSGLRNLVDLSILQQDPGKIFFDRGSPTIIAPKNTNAFSPPPRNSTRYTNLPSANDAIEATVSLTLMEYKESDAPTGMWGFENIQDAIAAIKESSFWKNASGVLSNSWNTFFGEVTK